MRHSSFLLCSLLCLTVLAFAGCNKDDGDNSDESKEKNYVIYGDNTYDIVNIQGGFMDEVAEIGGGEGYRFSLYIGSDETHCFPRLSKSCEGKTIDLTQHDTDVIYSLEVNDNNHIIDIHQNNQATDFFGIINRGSRQEGSIFNSGTMLITQNENTITFKVDGVLIDGKVFKINVKFEQGSEF